MRAHASGASADVQGGAYAHVLGPSSLETEATPRAAIDLEE